MYIYDCAFTFTDAYTLCILVCGVRWLYFLYKYNNSDYIAMCVYGYDETVSAIPCTLPLGNNDSVL